MVINLPCLTDKKELAIPGQTTTGKELSNLLMVASLPKTTLPTKLKKHKPKRKHTKEHEVPHTESQDKHNVPLPSPSHDLLPSGEDSLKLKELMHLCINLSKKVLDLESEVIDIKSTYKAKIETIESKAERLEEENKVSKKLNGVHYIADSDELVMENEESSKQGRKIADINADVEINLEKFKQRHIICTWVIKKRVNVNAAGVQDTPITVVEATKVIGEVPKPRKRREAQAKRNMIVYLKNMAGYKMNYFKEMSYDEIRPLFEKHYNYSQAFLNEVNEEIKVSEKEVRQEKEVEVKSSKRENATPLASKISTVDYKIHTERNKPYFKIIRADGKHMLFMSFSIMMKNLDREDFESLWKIIKERFEKTKPKNYTDEYLLNTLKIMFEKPNVETNV
nr:hypothetical protein [Tanacetum cinerariifolium]